ncbi:ParB N-terminal domain-containing protein [Chitinibacter sp. GC72]
MSESITAKQMQNGELMILNGHHRWWAAIQTGLGKVGVVISK